MKRTIYFVLALLVLSIQGRPHDATAAAPTEDVAMRQAAQVMSTPPFVEVEGDLRAWVLEKGPDFGVVLFEVKGTVPLHVHPDGNRRMFVVQGELEMLGGEHTMHMKPGDYMY